MKTINETNRIDIALILSAANSKELSTTTAAKFLAHQIRSDARLLPDNADSLESIAELFDNVAEWPDTEYNRENPGEQIAELDFALSELYDLADNVGIRVHTCD